MPVPGLPRSVSRRKTGMTVFLNGRFVPEEQAMVSVFDRSFLFGDGLFETIFCCHGRPFRWQQHVERLQAGAASLAIKIPFAPEELHRHALRLLQENQLADALVRITLSRGVGVRGYSSRGADQPFLVMACHPAPAVAADHAPHWRVITASVRVPASEPLALYKTCNKLSQIMARAEAEAHGADEALLLNTNGDVAEAAGSNVFWIENAMVCTTPLAAGILAGVTRGFVIELCTSLGIPCVERQAKPADLLRADAAFLTLSSTGIVAVGSLDGRPMGTSPLVEKLRAAYAMAVDRECAPD